MPSLPIRIACFNHKGGVGKTTLTVNVGSALAELGYRVLLVDSDPQCNLTAYAIDKDVLGQLLARSDSSRGRTIWSAVKPIVDGVGDIRRIAPIETSTAGVSVLPGDLKLSSFEAALGEFWIDCVTRRMRGFLAMSALRRVISACVRRQQYDFVFYDTGPNIGPLNRAILLDCDYFIVPAAPDLFSVRALSTLGSTLAAWMREWEEIAEVAPVDIDLLPGRPRYLGFVPQRFKVPGTSHVETALLVQFEKHLYEDVLVPLKRFDPSITSRGAARSRLGEVKDLGNLVALSQIQGCPVWKVRKGDRSQKQDAHGTFLRIAKQIASRIGREGNA
jgi:cellulose biosynthesis protein BcsQ